SAGSRNLASDTGSRDQVAGRRHLKFRRFDYIMEKHFNSQFKLISESKQLQLLTVLFKTNDSIATKIRSDLGVVLLKSLMEPYKEYSSLFKKFFSQALKFVFEILKTVDHKTTPFKFFFILSLECKQELTSEKTIYEKIINDRALSSNKKILLQENYEKAKEQ